MSATAHKMPYINPEEWKLRVDLAAVYRLVALFGWDDLIFTHASVRLPANATNENPRFLTNRFGLMFEEVTASNLVIVDHEGNGFDEENASINRAGFIIHSAIHAARPDAQCVLHCHSDYGMAVSAQSEGLLPLTQHSLFSLASLGYHDYEGLAITDGERARLAEDLGDKQCLILRNHGLLTVGASCGDAFTAMYNLEKACRIQILAQGTCYPLDGIDPTIRNGIMGQVATVTKGAGNAIAWPGLLRRLDRLDDSYRI